MQYNNINNKQLKNEEDQDHICMKQFCFFWPYSFIIKNFVKVVKTKIKLAFKFSKEKKKFIEI